MIFMEQKQHCKGHKYFISFLLYKKHCSDSCCTIASTLASLRGPIHHNDLETSAKRTRDSDRGTRSPRNLHENWKADRDRCVLHKIDVSQITCAEIFSSCVTWARGSRACNGAATAINHFAWSYILIKGKPFLHPNDGVFFAIKKVHTLVTCSKRLWRPSIRNAFSFPKKRVRWFFKYIRKVFIYK